MKCPKCNFHIETRSGQQNKLLWAGAYTPIAEYLTEASGKCVTREMVHEVAKDRFAERIVVEYNGKSKSYPKSSSSMGKKEFSDYLEQIYCWAAEMGIILE